MSLPYITVIGRLTRDPELRFTPSGKAVASFSVAASNRAKDGDEWVDKDTSFFDVTAWDRLGENIANEVGKGQEVVVYGQQKQRFWEDKEGNKRSSWEITATAVGLSMRWVESSPGNKTVKPAASDESDEAPPF